MVMANMIRFPTKIAIKNLPVKPTDNTDNGIPLLWSSNNPLRLGAEWQNTFYVNLRDPESTFTFRDLSFKIAYFYHLVLLTDSLEPSQTGYDLEASVVRTKIEISGDRNVIDEDMFVANPFLDVRDVNAMLVQYTLLTGGNLDQLIMLAYQEFDQQSLEMFIDTRKLQSIPGCMP